MLSVTYCMNFFLELGQFFFCKMLRGCQVCVICNFSFLNIQTLHNDYSYIEHVHLLFCSHLINISYF